MWADTPSGPIIAHYLLVRDDPMGDPARYEGMLPTFVPTGPAYPDSHYWLLQRLAHLGSCFLVLADGNQVIYNSRYVLLESFKNKLSDFLKKINIRAAAEDVLCVQPCLSMAHGSF